MATAKLEKLSQFDGGSSGPVVAYSSLVFSEAKSTTVSGSSTTMQAATRLTYLPMVESVRVM